MKTAKGGRILSMVGRVAPGTTFPELRLLGKNIFAVLRHVGRLREFKPVGSQQRCWHTR